LCQKSLLSPQKNRTPCIKHFYGNTGCGIPDFYQSHGGDITTYYGEICHRNAKTPDNPSLADRNRTISKWFDEQCNLYLEILKKILISVYIYTNDTPLLVPPSVVTVTETAPAAWAGTVTVIAVLLHEVTTALLDPKVTTGVAAPSAKKLPLIVFEYPPVWEPKAPPEKPLTVGTA
jgi:hypothetical protein